MVTKLQKIVDDVEDRHMADTYGTKHSGRQIHGRGSILNATPSEMKLIRDVAIPMNTHRKYIHGQMPTWVKDLHNGN